MKFITFSFAVTGAIVSYYLSQPNTGIMRWALVLPFIINALLAIFVFYSSRYVDYLDKELDRIRDTVGFLNVVDATFLTKMLYFVGVLSTVITLLLAVLFFTRPVT